ncbi:SHOCT domain-containing protein [Lachnospiraceae bacterium YH-ros2226]
MPTCAICGKNLPMLGINKIRLKGGDFVCLDCVKKAGHNPMTWTKNLSTTVDTLQAEIAGINKAEPAKKKSDIDIMKETFDRRRSSLGLGARARVSETFRPDKSFYKRFYIDTVHKKWQALGPVHNYSDLVSYEYQEDGGTVVSGGVGRAVVGGALFGSVGAVVGAATGKKKLADFVNSMKIRLTVKDMNNPTEYIDMNPVRIRMKRGSGQYRKNLEETQEILSCLELIIRENQKSLSASENSKAADAADEILKYKKLLDAGAITQEEYEAKKKQLLNL